MLHFKFLLAFLLPVLSVAAQTESGTSRRRLRVARQTSSADCTTPCAGITAALKASTCGPIPTTAGGPNSTCTSDVATDYDQCYNCEVSVGTFTQQYAQQVVDAYTQACSKIGQPVNSIAITAITASGSGGAGPTGAAAGAATGAAGAATGEAAGAATEEATGVATGGVTGAAGAATGGATGAATGEATGAATGEATGAATGEATGTATGGATGAAPTVSGAAAGSTPASAGSTPASAGSTPASGGSTTTASGPSKTNGAVKMSAGLGLTTAIVLLTFVI
ncbi:hypothetical protein K438DRAFT_1767011 [Mycena galopus ATCC 62051]|nr:hypothetical protein K438DRAFT_1767011 [Mycena galopus ATCC 62051]